MRKLTGLPLISMLLLQGACQKAGPEATVPSYIYIEKFQIDNSKSDLEIFSEKITDVWVYLDNAYQGAYELPAHIPLAVNGRHHLELRPGIKNAGISTDRKPYPYYQLFDLSSYNLKTAVTDTIKAVTFYDTSSVITLGWEEGFESLGPSYEINALSDTNIQIINRSEYPDLVFRDNRSGMIILEEPGYRFEMNSPTISNLPRNNIPIYLEINYKSNHPFIVGLYRDNKSEQIPIYVVKEQENWNKIYFDLTNYVQTSPLGSNFNVFIGFTRKSTVSRVEMYLDNIKLIHF